MPKKNWHQPLTSTPPQEELIAPVFPTRLSIGTSIMAAMYLMGHHFYIQSERLEQLAWNDILVLNLLAKGSGVFLIFDALPSLSTCLVFSLAHFFTAPANRKTFYNPSRTTLRYYNNVLSFMGRLQSCFFCLTLIISCSRFLESLSNLFARDFSQWNLESLVGTSDEGSRNILFGPTLGLFSMPMLFIWSIAAIIYHVNRLINHDSQAFKQNDMPIISLPNIYSWMGFTAQLLRPIDKEWQLIKAFYIQDIANIMDAKWQDPTLAIPDEYSVLKTLSSDQILKILQNPAAHRPPGLNAYLSKLYWGHWHVVLLHTTNDFATAAVYANLVQMLYTAYSWLRYPVVQVKQKSSTAEARKLSSSSASPPPAAANMNKPEPKAQQPTPLPPPPAIHTKKKEDLLYKSA